MQRHWIELYLLVLISEKPSHGYELSTRLEDFGITIAGTAQMGNLYRILSNLELSGFVNADWDTNEGGPAKKIYKITVAGLEYLEEATDNVVHTKKNLETFLEKYKKLRKTIL